MVDRGKPLPTVSAKVNKKELNAINEYANACGETISNLIRKVLLTDVTFMNFYSDSNEYHYDISIPDNVTGEEEDKIVLETYNKIRRILGLKENDKI